ncbi:MAG: hypothetical protein HY474_01380 [Candidatus Sungbacteria bacterium]|uniref:Uncharacterized protein n=1 Tax=Candidatus Sungiibacteriota bacterium TaxID=2750080 RepID=A0A932YXY4_9BACT|nr:hypothetical protein [Candidatus Sungbacteria bacterium]
MSTECSGEDVMVIRSRKSGEEPIILRPKCMHGVKVYVAPLPDWEKYFPYFQRRTLPDWHEGPCTHPPV